MKKQFVLIGVALGLAVGVFAGLWTAGSNTASAGQFDEGIKCYRAKVLATENPISRTIYIQDQFEAKNLVVKKPTEFCWVGMKRDFASGNTAGDFYEPAPMMCYAIKDAPRQQPFRKTEIVVFDQFDEQYLQLTKPYSLCEEVIYAFPAAAGAVFPTAAGTFDAEPFEDFSFKCYKVRRLESGRFEKIEIEVFDEVTGPEGKETRLLRPALFCSQVEEKKRKAKNDEIDNPQSISSGDEIHVSTLGTDALDRSDPEIDCPQDSFDSYGHSVWYSFYTSSDVYIHVDTTGSSFDTVLGIFSGSPGNLTQIACDDDGGGDLTSLIETKVPGGQKYYIVAGSYGANPGGKLKLFLDTDDFECIITCGAGSTAASVVDQDAEGGSAGIYPQDIMCYTISQPAPDFVEFGSVDQLNLHILELGRGTMYCAAADKCFLKERFAGTTEIAGVGKQITC